MCRVFHRPGAPASRLLACATHFCFCACAGVQCHVMCRIVGGVCRISLLRRPGGMCVRTSDRRPRGLRCRAAQEFGGRGGGATHEGHMQSYGSQTDVGVAAGLKLSIAICLRLCSHDVLTQSQCLVQLKFRSIGFKLFRALRTSLLIITCL